MAPILANPRAGTVFVVDDEPATVELVARALKLAGYRVRTALDGADALAMILDEPPDLVLLDMAMPGLGGARVIDELRRRGLGVVPVVAVTGVDYEARRAVGEGLASCLCKPFTLDELLACVASYVS